MSLSIATTGVEVVGDAGEAEERVLTPEALAFVAELHREFDRGRLALLAARSGRRRHLDFLPETRGVREDPTWRVAPPPRDLLDRRVELTGSVDRRTIDTCLRSGAQMFTADFAGASWSTCVDGQASLLEAVEETMAQEGVATLFVRPRGWHASEANLLVEGEPVSASLLDFGLYVCHCTHRLIDRGAGPYLSLAGLESHLEARLWNDVFRFAEARLSIARGTIRAAVVVETVHAALELEEILYELREHSAGLTAGHADCALGAFSDLLVATCHRRGAHAIGGVGSFAREAGVGFDGTSVADPELVGKAMCVFDHVLGERPNQLDRLRHDVSVTAAELMPAGHGHLTRRER